MNYIIDDEDLARLEYYICENNYLAHGWILHMKDSNKIEKITEGNIMNISWEKFKHYWGSQIFSGESMSIFVKKEKQ